jgi:hypothetical protein
VVGGWWLVVSWELLLAVGCLAEKKCLIH